MLNLKIKIFTILLIGTVAVNAQTSQYRYKRNLQGTTINWHSLQVPSDVFKNAQPGLEDLRIFGFKGKDTVEVPYILKQSANQISENETPVQIINQTKTSDAFFYTFQASSIAAINQIKLSFKQQNFDWKITLEGSNDNKQWFTIVSDYRILAIKNSNTDYHFTDLNFPTAKYTYFRMAVKASEQPELTTAKILKTDTVKGVFREIAYKSYQLKNDPKSQQSVIDIILQNPSPVTSLTINTNSNFDFYRALKIEYVTDSFKTDRGMQYNYAPLYDGTISSLETPVFNFTSTLLSRLKVTIENNDNRPLALTTFGLQGQVYEVIGRFDDPSLKYALFYGSRNANAPDYELKNFENKIPAGVTLLAVGAQEENPAFTTIKPKAPLFENKLWLWCLMGVIIILLGAFAFKMLKN